MCRFEEYCENPSNMENFCGVERVLIFMQAVMYPRYYLKRGLKERGGLQKSPCLQKVDFTPNFTIISIQWRF